MGRFSENTEKTQQIIEAHEKIIIVTADQIDHLEAEMKVIKQSKITLNSDKDNSKTKHVEQVKENETVTEVINNEIAIRITTLEGDPKDDNKESDNNDIIELFTCNVCSSQFKVKHMFKDHIETSVLQLRCCKCNFVGETCLSLKKHINTKHEPQSIETNNKEEDKLIVTDCVLDGIDDLFRLK